MSPKKVTKSRSRKTTAKAGQDAFPMGIRCGTVVHGNADTPKIIEQLLPHGFECFALTFGHMKFDLSLDLKKLGNEIQEVLAGSGATVSAIGVYGNPVLNTPAGKEVRQGWRKMVDNAHHFGTDVVAGFSGAADGEDIPTSVKAVAKVFKPLAKRAADKGVKIAFENCPMGGNWRRVRANTAICPKAWELLFEAIPGDNVGIEWEPCHQMLQFVDVLAQARQWADRIFHIQGKDATIAWDVLRTHGRDGGEPWCWHRTPGFGDLNWSDLFTVLRQQKWTGSVAIEGWHDPVYRSDLELAGQIRGVNYLKEARGGDYVPYPTA